jgi:RNA polymerase sigma factor (sigma-70 family)|tara:strand:+ start:23 stop:547 length:525 start_codon:yes stop_codon:yes gene_type:complete
MEINNELVAQWEPKIQKMSSNSYVVGLDKEDLAQELRIALIKAARAYDDSKGAIFHTYLHTSLVNTIRTLITKAQRKPIARSIDLTFDGSNTIPKEIAAAMVEPKNYTEEVEADIWIHAQGLNEKEKLFLELKLEGLTMEEITEDLGESAYKVRQSLRDKLQELKDRNAEKDET